MALGSTQPVTGMSTRGISCGVKGGRCFGLTTLSFSYAGWKFWEPQLTGAPKALYQAFIGIALPSSFDVLLPLRNLNF